MPLILKKEEDRLSFAVWKVEESLSFFQNKMDLSPAEKEETQNFSPARLLEWYAARYLLALLHGQKQRVPLHKDKYGKPFFADKNTNLSISHSGDMVAAALSPYHTGIDLQIISEKVKSIKNKFLSPDELDFCDDDLLCLNKMWTIKEALYKAYGKKGLIFKENIKIPYFFRDKNGYIGNAVIDTKADKKNYMIFGYELDNAIMSIATELEE